MIRAFLSFVEEDLNVVNLFRGQAKNQNSDLEFADYSTLSWVLARIVPERDVPRPGERP